MERCLFLVTTGKNMVSMFTDLIVDESLDESDLQHSKCAYNSCVVMVTFSHILVSLLKKTESFSCSN